jgi:hypothetical protein
MDRPLSFPENKDGKDALVEKKKKKAKARRRRY